MVILVCGTNFCKICNTHSKPSSKIMYFKVLSIKWRQLCYVACYGWHIYFFKGITSLNERQYTTKHSSYDWMYIDLPQMTACIQLNLFTMAKHFISKPMFSSIQTMSSPTQTIQSFDSTGGLRGCCARTSVTTTVGWGTESGPHMVVRSGGRTDGRTDSPSGGLHANIFQRKLDMLHKCILTVFLNIQYIMTLASHKRHGISSHRELYRLLYSFSG